MGNQAASSAPPPLLLLYYYPSSHPQPPVRRPMSGSPFSFSFSAVLASSSLSSAIEAGGPDQQATKRVLWGVVECTASGP